MKAVLICINASFSHTTLAGYYLAASCRHLGADFVVVEANINERAEVIALRLLEEEPVVLLCSVYIWNRRLMEDVCIRLKTMRPEITIIWGGPEVSGSLENIFSRLPFLAYLVQGEGEELLPHLLAELRAGREPSLPGLSSPGAVSPVCAKIMSLDDLPDPYAEEMCFSPHRIYYFESSRGCPYSCAYCLSAREPGVRFMSLDLAQSRLASLSQNTGLIKFVDRTFNADPARTRQLWTFLLSRPGGCRFHFEICAHLLTEADFALLQNPAAKRFQFEVGLQSTLPAALAQINRNMDTARLLANVERLVRESPVEVHLDLISGLPGEGLADFLSSFDAALGVLPDRLHLGFLKILPGTPLSSLVEREGYGVLPYAPYEVLRTPLMTPEDFLHLKKIERALERFYNARGVRTALLYALTTLKPHQLFALLAESMAGELSVEEALYLALAPWVADRHLLMELCQFDYLANEPHKQMPPSLAPAGSEEGRLLRKIIYGDQGALAALLPHRQDKKPGVILRTLRLGAFSPATMVHLGLADQTHCIFDHTLPLPERVRALVLKD